MNTKEYAHQWYLKNKERLALKNKERHLKNKEADATYKNAWYQTNKPRILGERKEYHEKVVKTRAEKNRLFVGEYKQKTGCQICGDKTLPSECYDLHHRDPETKDHCVSQMCYRLDQIAIQEEMNKCIVVCANCHRKITYGYVKLEA